MIVSPPSLLVFTFLYSWVANGTGAYTLNRRELEVLKGGTKRHSKTNKDRIEILEELDRRK
jgi:hypothetical protein